MLRFPCIYRRRCALTWRMTLVKPVGGCDSPPPQHPFWTKHHDPTCTKFYSGRVDESTSQVQLLIAVALVILCLLPFISPLSPFALISVRRALLQSERRRYGTSLGFIVQNSTSKVFKWGLLVVPRSKLKTEVELNFAKSTFTLYFNHLFLFLFHIVLSFFDLLLLTFPIPVKHLLTSVLYEWSLVACSEKSKITVSCTLSLSSQHKVSRGLLLNIWLNPTCESLKKLPPHWANTWTCYLDVVLQLLPPLLQRFGPQMGVPFAREIWSLDDLPELQI